MLINAAHCCTHQVNTLIPLFIVHESWTNCLLYRNPKSLEASKNWHSGRAIIAERTMQNKNCCRKLIICVHQSAERSFLPSTGRFWQEWVYFIGHHSNIIAYFGVLVFTSQMVATCCTYAIVFIQLYWTNGNEKDSEWMACELWKHLVFIFSLLLSGFMRMISEAINTLSLWKFSQLNLFGAFWSG